MGGGASGEAPCCGVYRDPPEPCRALEVMGSSSKKLEELWLGVSLAGAGTDPEGPRRAGEGCALVGPLGRNGDCRSLFVMLLLRGGGGILLFVGTC